jgi:hypothetical protein
MLQSFSEEIIKNIEVREPYFALNNLRFSDGKIHACVPKEHPMDNELGCMAAAEAGRHLAILGSCALAHTNPKKEKHYYIAHKAKLTSLSHTNESYDSLHAVSRTESFNSRLGKAHATLFNQAEPVFDLEVQYHVIREKVFHKLYKNKAVEQVNSKINPYENSFDLTNIEINEEQLKADLGPLSPEHCIGHFEIIPCLPVAVLMHALSRSAGLLLSSICQSEVSYRVLNASINAENFAFAGDLVNISVEKVSQENNDYNFKCVASGACGITYGDMNLTLAAIKS